ncbi:hypothetical protein RB195_003732 [Necator americanus]|uniref:Uncharacterized protein n=1 Tax=Necator americanus TaxID=51031 RepID=A0ABR1DPV5_NECAM
MATAAAAAGETDDDGRRTTDGRPTDPSDRPTNRQRDGERSQQGSARSAEETVAIQRNYIDARSRVNLLRTFCAFHVISSLVELLQLLGKLPSKQKSE